MNLPNNSKLMTVADATFIHNDTATPELLQSAVIRTIPSLGSQDNPFEPLKTVPMDSNDRNRPINVAQYFDANAQGFLDCYRYLSTFDFKSAFKQRFKQRYPDDNARLPDPILMDGLMDVSVLFAEDVQTMIPEIVNQFSGSFPTGRGDSNKELRVASFGMTHSSFVTAGCITIMVDQFMRKIASINGKAIEKVIEAANADPDAQNLSDIGHDVVKVYLNEAYERHRFVLPFKLIAANVMAYSFMVAHDIVSTRFSKTYDKKGDYGYRKTSEAFKSALKTFTEVYTESGNEDPHEVIDESIKMSIIQSISNRMMVMSERIRHLDSLARTNKWSDADKLNAQHIMMQIACKFMQKHYDNLRSDKYADHILDKCMGYPNA